jgi:hypothetical protein
MAHASRRRWLLPLAGIAAAAAAAAVVGAAAPAGNAATICNGFLPPGTYRGVVVPPGGACFSDGPVVIGFGLTVGAGGTFVLGDEEAPGGNGSISGGVHATDPASVQIHFTTIIGGIDIQGGSGPFGGPFDITWNAIEDNKIFGDVFVEGYDGFWFGFIRNHVQGNVNLNDNVLEDPDGNEYVTNRIRGSLNCEGNNPAPQVGDSEGGQNRVIGPKTGQCVGL